MKKTILVDIGIIVEYLKTGKGLLPKAYEAYKMQIISSTYVELLSSQTFQNPELEKEVLDFLHKYFEVIPVDEKIAQSAAKVIRENEKTLAVSLLAGAAVANSLELLTDDKKEFEGIEGVTLVQL
ncbi:hypothetical protein KC678_04475 [Candidatus Dojkabacteria bacterium]|uniref:PIN domain-containing protein n=1 Tax=Candidatus Dojkabacteria bacterium TaxID=2099670 RepID=A0A955RHJ8_9BACT|nr:hypothetical protein [Candidatus Dojkabacteria bacterium]